MRPADNLLPLAVDYPESHFVGVDLSRRQIDAGKNAIAGLDLQNIELHALDLNEMSEDFGTFDYIICHGVFSWVPPGVQDKILEIGRRHLAANGIFVVSYNAYPGWHMRGVVRDMMVFHVRDLEDSTTKVRQARALLEFLTRSANPSNETYHRLLRDEAAILKTRQDGYLYHEHLEDINEPLYFYQFVERAAAAELKYLGDADLPSMLPLDMGDDVNELLKEASLLQQEQYLDFLRNRMFRTSLMCQREVNLERQLDSLRLVECDVGLEEALDLPPRDGDASQELVCQTSVGRIRVAGSLAQTVLHLLNEAWPGSLPFDALFNEAKRLSPESPADMSESQQRHSLAADLLNLYLRRLVFVWDEAPHCLAAPGDRPQTTRLVRWQAARGRLVTNRRHETLRLTELETFILAQLDGQHTREKIRSSLAERIESGEWTVRTEGSEGARLSDSELTEVVDRTLTGLAKQALMI